MTVAGLTVSLGSSAAPAMSDASFDAETTQLAVRARAGDRDAFCALVDLHHRAARRVAAAALGNPADADEAVQEACLTAWRRIDRLDDPAAFRAWLLRITWRKALDRRRSIVDLAGPVAASAAKRTTRRYRRRFRRPGRIARCRTAVARARPCAGADDPLAAAAAARSVSARGERRSIATKTSRPCSAAARHGEVAHGRGAARPARKARAARIRRANSDRRNPRRSRSIGWRAGSRRCRWTRRSSPGCGRVCDESSRITMSVTACADSPRAVRPGASLSASASSGAASQPWTGCRRSATASDRRRRQRESPIAVAPGEPSPPPPGRLIDAHERSTAHAHRCRRIGAAWRRRFAALPAPAVIDLAHLQFEPLVGGAGRCVESRDCATSRLTDIGAADEPKEVGHRMVAVHRD